MPAHKMLSSFTVSNSSLVGLATVLEPQKRVRRSSVDGRSLLTMLILRERARETSELMPYVQIILTHDVRNVPMLFQPASPEFAALSEFGKSRARVARTLALKDYEKIKAEFDQFRSQLSEGIKCKGGTHDGTIGGGATACPMEQLLDIYSEQKFLEVYAIVRARDWQLPMYNRDTFMMVPIMDMLNYGQVGLRVSFIDNRDAFVMKATSPIKHGSELLFYYGSFCKEYMIDLYGFAVPKARNCRYAAKRLFPRHN